jgi:hypothetical protein
MSNFTSSAAGKRAQRKRARERAQAEGDQEYLARHNTQRRAKERHRLERAALRKALGLPEGAPIPPGLYDCPTCQGPIVYEQDRGRVFHKPPTQYYDGHGVHTYGWTPPRRRRW